MQSLRRWADPMHKLRLATADIDMSDAHAYKESEIVEFPQQFVLLKELVQVATGPR